MTLHSERHTPKTENPGDRQNSTRANEAALPAPEHKKDDTTFTEALASASETNERAKKSLKEVFAWGKRKVVRRTLGGVAAVTAVGALVWAGDNEKTEAPAPNAPAVSAPKTVETTITLAPPKESYPQYAENSLRFKEAKPLTVTPDAYVTLPPAGLSPKETSDDFFGRALNQAANSKSEEGQWRPELLENLFDGDSKGLQDMSRAIIDLQQQYDTLKLQGKLEPGSFIHFRHKTLSVERHGVYIGADVVKEEAFGHILNPQGFVAYTGYPLEGKYIFDPQKYTMSRFPDGTEKKGVIVKNVWKVGDEIPDIN